MKNFGGITIHDVSPSLIFHPSFFIFHLYESLNDSLLASPDVDALGIRSADADAL